MAAYSLEALRRYREEHPETQSVPPVEEPAVDAEEEPLALHDEDQDEDIADIYERWLDRSVGFSY